MIFITTDLRFPVTINPGDTFMTIDDAPVTRAANAEPLVFNTRKDFEEWLRQSFAHMSIK